ncbi:hypothetical protein ATY78_06405 [Rhizobium sp. R635]|nr:hypothetical protein ATY78_06405 [Rhizobium sp. R635]
MKHDKDKVGRNRPFGSTISRPFRDLWHWLVEPITALRQGWQPKPVRVVAETTDRNHPRQRY